MSTELLARLHSFPDMKSELDNLPSKLLSLTTDNTKVVQLQPMANEERVTQVLERVEQAIFTGEADRADVPVLYKNFVERIASVLQRTLGFAGAKPGSQPGGSNDGPPAPAMALPTEVPLLLLADGQMLLQLADTDGRRAGGEGKPQFGTVQVSQSLVQFS